MSGLSEALFFETVRPAAEKTRFEGAEVAGMQRIFIVDAEKTSGVFVAKFNIPQLIEQIPPFSLFELLFCTTIDASDELIVNGDDL